MAQHDDVLHPEGLHGEFERRRGAVIFAADLMGGTGSRCAPRRVRRGLHRATSGETRLSQQLITMISGALPVGQFLVAPLLALEAVAEEEAVTFEESVGQHELSP